MRFLLVILIPLCLAAAPKVLKTVPENGKNDIDPQTSELRVVFDQPMRPGGRSVVNSSRPCSVFDFTRASRPGSQIGILPA